MNIYESINKVMSEIGAIGKNDTNKQQGFKYRGIDAVMNAIQPALVKHKVFVVPEVIEQKREERQTSKGGNLIYSICTVCYTFYAEDGTSVQATVIGEGMDSGDKATNKAMSIAFKYACFQVFCIPTEEMKEDDFKMVDPDAECHTVQAKMIDSQLMGQIKLELLRVGYTETSVLKKYKVKSLNDLTMEQAESCLEGLKGMPDKCDAQAK